MYANNDKTTSMKKEAASKVAFCYRDPALGGVIPD